MVVVVSMKVKETRESGAYTRIGKSVKRSPGFARLVTSPLASHVPF